MSKPDLERLRNLSDADLEAELLPKFLNRDNDLRSICASIFIEGQSLSDAVFYRMVDGAIGERAMKNASPREELDLIYLVKDRYSDVLDRMPVCKRKASASHIAYLERLEAANVFTTKQVVEIPKNSSNEQPQIAEPVRTANSERPARKKRLTRKPENPNQLAILKSRVKRAIDKEGYKDIEQLAKNLDVSRAALYGMMNGEQNRYSEKKLKHVLKKLKVEKEWLAAAEDRPA
jgi:hypothetical protein